MSPTEDPIVELRYRSDPELRAILVTCIRALRTELASLEERLKLLGQLIQRRDDLKFSIASLEKYLERM